MSMCDALCRGCGWSQTTWFDPIGVGFCFKPPGLTPIGVGFCFKPPGLTPIGVGFCFKPPGLAPIGGRFGIKPPGLAPIGVGFCIKPPGLAPIGGRFGIKPPGLAPIGVGFCFKPLVWPESGSGFASNHWFGPNRGRILLQTIGLTQTKPLGSPSFYCSLFVPRGRPTRKPLPMA